MLPFNRRTAYKYITIAEKFAPLLPGVQVDGSVSSMTQLEENLADNEQINELSGIGMTKLYEIATIPDSDFNEVMSDKKFEINGREYSIEEIKAQTVKELQDEVRAEKKQLQKRLANLEEENKKHKSERDHYKKQLDENEELIERSREREAMHGPEARKIEDIEYNLERAEAHLTKLQIFFTNVEVDEEDPQMLRDRVLSILSSVTALPKMASRRMEWLKDLENYERQFFSPVKVKDPRLDPESDEFDPDSTIDEEKVIRTDSQRMAIKFKTTHGLSHGWANLEKGFETEEEMQQRFNELLESGKYTEG